MTFFHAQILVYTFNCSFSPSYKLIKNLSFQTVAISPILIKKICNMIGTINRKGKDKLKHQWNLNFIISIARVYRGLRLSSLIWQFTFWYTLKCFWKLTWFEFRSGVNNFIENETNYLPIQIKNLLQCNLLLSTDLKNRFSKESIVIGISEN